jgi:hypothetical protein
VAAPKKSGSSKPSTDNRSAVTGRFVTEKYAKSHKNTTVRETNKKK